jgi:hypothetical protein
MQETLEFIRNTSPVILLLLAAGYLLKLYVEKRVEGLAQRIEVIAATSLDVKKGLRNEERAELIYFRVAVEKWEYFLQTAVVDFSMQPPASADITALYTQDKALFLDVRIATVKACTYLRQRELERQVMASLLKIRQTYYPLMNLSLARLIEQQAQLRPLTAKLNAFQQSGMKDMAYAPTAQDRQLSAELHAAMTAEVRKFSDGFLQQYRDIAVQMNELKETMNNYIYRPLNSSAIDEE